MDDSVCARNTTTLAPKKPILCYYRKAAHPRHRRALCLWLWSRTHDLLLRSSHIEFWCNEDKLDLFGEYRAILKLVLASDVKNSKRASVWLLNSWLNWYQESYLREKTQIVQMINVRLCGFGVLARTQSRERGRESCRFFQVIVFCVECVCLMQGPHKESLSLYMLYMHTLWECVHAATFILLY